MYNDAAAFEAQEAPQEQHGPALQYPVVYEAPGIRVYAAFASQRNAWMIKGEDWVS